MTGQLLPQVMEFKVPLPYHPYLPFRPLQCGLFFERGHPGKGGGGVQGLGKSEDEAASLSLPKWWWDPFLDMLLVSYGHCYWYCYCYYYWYCWYLYLALVFGFHIVIVVVIVLVVVLVVFICR